MTWICYFVTGSSMLSHHRAATKWLGHFLAALFLARLPVCFARQSGFCCVFVWFLHMLNLFLRNQLLPFLCGFSTCYYSLLSSSMDGLQTAFMGVRSRTSWSKWLKLFVCFELFKSGSPVLYWGYVVMFTLITDLNCSMYCTNRSWDSSVTIVTRLLAGSTQGSNPAESKRFLFSPKCLWPVPGPTEPHIQRVPGVKQPGHGVDNSSPFSPRVRKRWSYASTPHLCLHGRDRDKFPLFVLYWCCRKTHHWLSPLQVPETVILSP